MGNPDTFKAIYFCIWFRNRQTLYKFHMEKINDFPKCPVKHIMQYAQMHDTCMQATEHV